jgi:hypothetical protein
MVNTALDPVSTHDLPNIERWKTEKVKKGHFLVNILTKKSNEMANKQTRRVRAIPATEENPDTARMTEKSTK